MARIRRDIAKLGGAWSEPMLWYARAVRRLQARPIGDRTSWRYLAAIHGFDQPTWIARRVITAADQLPPTAERNNRIWNQCQHQGWYFLPWHRGYLAAFEEIVGRAVADLGGPAEWALPYWNYLDTSNPQARDIPQALLDPRLPDGTPNPLSAAPRSPARRLGPVPWFPNDIDLQAMRVRRYTSAQRTLGFGGGQTVFNTFGGQTGAIEDDPHNSVHVIVGAGGFMEDPGLAGLDPIFWLHHCNVDRLWAAWLRQPGNVQESSAAWRNGPAPRRFEMPTAAGALARFTPGETLPGGRLAPIYDDLSAGTGFGALPAALDDDEDEVAMPASLSDAPPPAAALVGANAERVVVQDAAATTVALDVSAVDPAGDAVESRVYLNLENVRGTTPSGVLNVLVRTPGQPAEEASHPVKSVALFGLARASDPNGAHGGGGMTIAIDITDLARRLAQQAGQALEQLDVRLEQPDSPGGKNEISVERVSVYRQPVE